METFLFYSELVGFVLLGLYISLGWVRYRDLDQLTSDHRLILLYNSSIVTGIIFMACGLMLLYGTVDWMLNPSYMAFSMLTYLTNVLAVIAVLPAVWSCIVISRVHRKVKELKAIPI